MELNGYRLLLPEGTLDYFDLVDVKESVNEVVIYLEEKNIAVSYTHLRAHGDRTRSRMPSSA